MDSSSGWAVAPAVSAAAPTMLIGGILAMAGVFLVFLTFALALIFLRYYFNTSVRAAPRGRPRARGAREAAAGGVNPELLRSLPVTVYCAGPKGPTDDVGVECAVCLTELEDGEEARFLPRCGHGFHTECVDMWLASHSSCPLCRATVGKPEASQALTSTSLPSLSPEPVNYTGNLPASVLLGVSDQATLAAVTVTSHGGHSSPSALATVAVLVIDIPDSRTVATPRGASKSSGLARLRSLKRLWSFGRQGPSGSTPPAPAAAVAEQQTQTRVLASPVQLQELPFSVEPELPRTCGHTASLPEINSDAYALYINAAAHIHNLRASPTRDVSWHRKVNFTPEKK